MGFSIELHFDTGIDAAVRDLRAHLLPVDTGGFALDYEFHPHITLAYFKEAPSEEILDQIKSLSSKLESLRFTLSHVGLFPGSSTSVVFLGLTPSADLSAVHAQVQEYMERLGLPPESHYRVGNFIPHVTLGDKIANGKIEQVIGAIGQASTLTLPCSGIAERMVVATDRPIASCPLLVSRAPAQKLQRGIERT